MELKFKTTAEEHLNYWKKKDKRILKKIGELLSSINETPFEGIGKPEALKYDLSGYWSRRINTEHRIVYKVDEENNTVVIYSLKGHYEK